MTATGSNIIDFLQQGTAASRPSTPNAQTNTLSYWFATDTLVLSYYDWNASTWRTVSGATGANPTATASDVAVNGSAGTFMRSDGAPAIQKTSSSVFGLCKVDNSTITASSGVISAVASSTVVSPGGRLTLTSATPVMTTDVTGATTVYYALYNGNQIPIYNGSTFASTTFTELSQATTDNTKSPAACTTNSNYDLFVWSDSGTIRCTRGPLWTSDTARGTGAGTTELQRVLGIWTNKVSITNGPGANLGTYVGTIRTNGSSQVDMIFGGAGAAGGESSILGVWNCYNRLPTTLINFDNTDSWNYTTLTWRVKNNNNANQIKAIVGLSEDAAHLSNGSMSKNTGANVDRMLGIGLNSTTAIAAGCTSSRQAPNVANGYAAQLALWDGRAPLGLNTWSPLEESVASGTTTWYGDEGSNGITNSLFVANYYS